MTPLRLAALGLGLVAGLGSSGCSFKLVRRPPAPSEWPATARPTVEAERCTSSLAPPLLDVVATLMLSGAAIYERRWESPWPPIFLGVAAVPVAISAGYGFGAVVQCRRYQRLFTPPP